MCSGSLRKEGGARARDHSPVYRLPRLPGRETACARSLRRCRKSHIHLHRSQGRQYRCRTTRSTRRRVRWIAAPSCAARRRRASSCLRWPPSWPPAARARPTASRPARPRSGGAGRQPVRHRRHRRGRLPAGPPGRARHLERQTDNPVIADGMKPETASRSRSCAGRTTSTTGSWRRSRRSTDCKVRHRRHRVHRHGRGPGEDQLGPGRLRHAVRHERVGGRDARSRPASCGRSTTTTSPTCRRTPGACSRARSTT